MDWGALRLSIELALWTIVVLIPVSILIARPLAWRDFGGKPIIEALVALPLVLPPTVLGYYLLINLGGQSWLGRGYEALSGRPLVFTFEGLLLASVVFNIPFSVQPIQRAFAAIPRSVREAAWCSGLSTWQAFWRIEVPLAWPGIVSAAVITFAHTLGEFGVVLMIGGNIPGQTKTIAIAIYDRVQAFDDQGAAIMAAVLLAISFVAIVGVYLLAGRRPAHG